MSSPAPTPSAARNRTHYLYLAVVAAVALGVLVGAVSPSLGRELKPLGTGFVNPKAAADLVAYFQAEVAFERDNAALSRPASRRVRRTRSRRNGTMRIRRRKRISTPCSTRSTTP